MISTRNYFGWGNFIVLEGIDGSGTTTIAERLCEKLGAVYTHEPTSGPIGLLIRAYLRGDVTLGGQGKWGTWKLDAETMALLYTADRMDHQPFIRHYLSSGQSVICDRYHYSTLAYQTATVGREGIDLKIFTSWLIELANYCLEPDLVIVLDVDCEEAEARRSVRCRDKEVFEVSELQKKIAEIYEFFPGVEFQHFIGGERSSPRRSYMNIPGNIVHISANCPEDEVFEKCLRLIEG